MWRFLTFSLFFSCSCGSLKKDNPPHDPIEDALESVHHRYKIYSTESLKVAFDVNGLYNAHGTVGDSALFTAIAYAAGVVEPDVSLFFTEEGKPLRHPNISEKDSATPISKDMVNGILWMLYTLGKTDKDKALNLINKMIDYGRKNAILGNWNFCSKEDIQKYNIDIKDSLGRCVMTPALMKDTHRVAISLGRKCDALCQTALVVGTNPAVKPKNFAMHLAALTTARNGLVEGGINDNSLKQLEKMVVEEPRNALYSSIYYRFKNGNQDRTWILLSDPKLYPEDSLPTHENYCSDYLFQRQEKRYENLEAYTKEKEGGGSTQCVKFFHPDTKELTEKCDVSPNNKGEVKTYVYNDDWLSCDSDKGPRSAIDWIFAYKMALGEI